MKNRLSVCELSYKNIENIVDYFLEADDNFLLEMGADPSKLPAKKDWLDYMINELKKDNSQKSIYYVTWQLDNESVGHSNINDIVFGSEAFMHLHMWKTTKRNKGLGAEFVKRSIPYFFENFKLNTLYCRPYALNPAPNSTLQKLGFDFIKTYEVIPGRISFKQKVNLYELTKEKFEHLYKNF